jgi:hypothetical protein
MPTGVHLLHTTFERSLQAILDLQEVTDRNQALSILCWVLYAARPLSVEELSEGLAVHNGWDMWKGNIRELEFLCGSLIQTWATTGGLGSTVHLAHFSIKEFLLKNPLVTTCGSFLFDNFKDTTLQLFAIKSAQHIKINKSGSNTFELYLSQFWAKPHSSFFSPNI